MMIWLTVAFAIATAATVAFSVRRQPERLAATLLAVSWAISVLLSLTTMPRDLRLNIGAGLDTAGALIAIIVWRVIWPPKAWLLVLALELFAQVTAHRTLDTAPRGTLGATLNVLYALQLLTIVIGPRVGQIVGHARDLLCNLFPAPSDRVRGRGVVARADSLVQKIGAYGLREKSR